MFVILDVCAEHETRLPQWRSSGQTEPGQNLGSRLQASCECLTWRTGWGSGLNPSWFCRTEPGSVFQGSSWRNSPGLFQSRPGSVQVDPLGGEEPEPDQWSHYTPVKLNIPSTGSGPVRSDQPEMLLSNRLDKFMNFKTVFIESDRVNQIHWSWTGFCWHWFDWVYWDFSVLLGFIGCLLVFSVLMLGMWRLRAVTLANRWRWSSRLRSLTPSFLIIRGSASPWRLRKPESRCTSSSPTETWYGTVQVRMGPIRPVNDQVLVVFQVFVSKDVARHFGFDSPEAALRGLYPRVKKGWGSKVQWNATDGSGSDPSVSQGCPDLCLGRKRSRRFGSWRSAAPFRRFSSWNAGGHAGSRRHLQRRRPPHAVQRWGGWPGSTGSDPVWFWSVNVSVCRRKCAGRAGLWLQDCRQEVWFPWLRRHQREVMQNQLVPLGTLGIH